jgi:hypothetical protein
MAAGLHKNSLPAVAGEALGMPIVKITSHGLRTIAVLVAILWGSIVLEKAMIRHARRDTARALDRLRDLRRKREAVPASFPIRHMPARPAVG